MIDWNKLLSDLGIHQKEPSELEKFAKRLRPVGEAELNDMFGERPPDPAQLEAISASDRAWFKANPSRKIRVRPPMAGDHTPTGAKFPVVIVTEIAPGLRSRRTADLRLLPNPPELAMAYVDATGFVWGVAPGRIEPTEERAEGSAGLVVIGHFLRGATQ
jgi:hypothetical protein